MEIEKGYTVNIWNKAIRLYHVVHESDNIDYIFLLQSPEKCAKCDFVYGEKPVHGDRKICISCGSEFSFYGALHPRPAGATRKEIEAAL